MALNTTTWDLRGIFRDGVVITNEDIEKAKRYTDLLNAMFLTPLEQGEKLMLRTQLAPLIEQEYIR